MSKTNPKLIDFKLSKKHQHAGKPCEPGDIIQVPAHVADMLEKNEVGKRTAPAPGATS